MSERWSGIFKRSKVKIIVLPVIAVICAVLLVAGNIVLSMFNPILHRVFSGDGISVSGSASVLSEADKVVRKTAEESMVLLY
ncbi:MAG: hypothetical protein K2K80_07760, partial [Clostridia bacterium]|nr:hypothetical protein [Clostridia bacterium]